MLFDACTNRALSEAKQMGKEVMWPRARDAEDAEDGDAGGGARTGWI